MPKSSLANHPHAARRYPPNALEQDEDALKHEERDNAVIPLAPQRKPSALVKQARRKERAQHETDSPCDRLARVSSVNKKSPAEDLVPTLRPELRERRRREWVVEYGRPRRWVLAQKANGDEGEGFVERAKACDDAHSARHMNGGAEGVALERGVATAGTWCLREGCQRLARA